MFAYKFQDYAAKMPEMSCSEGLRKNMLYMHITHSQISHLTHLAGSTDLCDDSLLLLIHRPCYIRAT